MSTKAIEVHIERLALGGVGVARAADRALLVPGVCVGERVRVIASPPAHPTRGRPGGRAEVALLDVIEPSPDRVAPPCPYVGACGGCDMMHVAEARQLEILAALVRDQLAHATRADVPAPTLSRAPRPLGYRTRARLAFECRAGKRGGVQIGYRRKGSHDLVAIDRCLVLDARVEAGIAEARAILEGAAEAGRATRGELSIALGAEGKPALEVRPDGDLAPAVFGRIDAAIQAGRIAGARVWARGASAPIVAGDPRIEQRGADGAPIRLAAGSFAQPSDDGAAILVGRVRAAVEALVPPAARERARAVELFSGSGTLTVALAAIGLHELTAVEIDKAACAEARANLAARSLSASVVTADAEAHAIPTSTDLVVLDPPRTGARSAIERVVAAKPRWIVYVSCDPMTLARDLEPLAKGGWVIRSVDAIELFPQTSHVETVVALERARRSASGEAKPQ